MNLIADVNNAYCMQLTPETGYVCLTFPIGGIQTEESFYER